MSIYYPSYCWCNMYYMWCDNVIENTEGMNQCNGDCLNCSYGEEVR